MRARQMGLAALLATAVPVGCATFAELGEPDDYDVTGAGGTGGAGGGPACAGADIEEGCHCTDEPPHLCYTGPSETLDVGACKAGTVTCVNTVWGPCAGEVTPAEETCNGVDDDCDGEVDDGNPGAGADCVADALGACKRGTMQCVAGAPVCVSNLQPEPESCDGMDNDCDGDTDEGAPDENLPCDTKQKGICKQGTTKCNADIGVLSCESVQNPKAEVCGTADDEDCDGGTGKAHFTHDFSTALAWTVSGTWAIKKAVGNCSDPSDDTTTTGNGMLAGVNVGGCVPQGSSGQLTSPQMSTVNLLGGQIWLKYQRRLQTSSSMKNTIEVRDNVSSSWKPIWASDGESINDQVWFSHRIDLTGYISPGASWFQLRWTYATGASADQGGWSIDDVEILDDDC